MAKIDTPPPAWDNAIQEWDTLPTHLKHMYWRWQEDNLEDALATLTGGHGPSAWDLLQEAKKNEGKEVDDKIR